MNTPTDPPTHNASLHTPSVGDNVLNIISGVQAELDRLKEAQEKQSGEREALAQLECELSERQAILTEREEALRAATADVEDRATALDARQEEHTHRSEALEQERQQVADQTHLLEDRQREIQQRADALERDRAELLEAQSQQDAKAKELDATSARLSEESAALSQQQSRFHEKQSSIEQALETRQQEADNRERKLAADAMGVDQLGRDAQQLKEELEEQLHQSRKDQDEIEREQDRLEQMRIKLVEQQHDAERLSLESVEHNERLAEFEAQITALTNERDEAIGSLQTLRDSALVEAESMRSRIAQLEDRERALAGELAEANQAIESRASDDEIASLQDDVDTRQNAIETLAQKLQSAHQQIESLTQRLDESLQSQDHASGASAAQALRRDRLKRVRRAMRQRTGRLAQAKEALDIKTQEADRVLESRRTIAAQRADLQKREQRHLARASGSRGVAALFLGVLAFVSLGVMSWAVVDRSFPATYLASATIAADESNGALSETQLESWTTYLASLTSDPRLIEVASQRMGRRGVSELATGGALETRLKTDLDLSTPAPGRLTLSFKGPGAQRSERLLDTLIASLVSVANDARNQRADGASTVVVDPPKAASEPLQDPRPLYAAIGWGAASVVLLLLSIGVWLRVGAAKRKLDEESAQMLAAGGQTFSSNSF